MEEDFKNNARFQLRGLLKRERGGGGGGGFPSSIDKDSQPRNILGFRNGVSDSKQLMNKLKPEEKHPSKYFLFSFFFKT